MTRARRGRSAPKRAATTPSILTWATSTRSTGSWPRPSPSGWRSRWTSRCRPPDHPWVTEHPEWFSKRADGSIAYAENPPKKYQDIYPINFDNDRDGIYLESLRILKLWMSHGIRIFRVDNPHTKPVNFWAWLLGEIRKTDPDVLFLSEAFTKPVMQALGKAGFQQGYTYFTWRNEKWEIEEYMTELTTETDSFFRPSFWVNTPTSCPASCSGAAGRPSPSGPCWPRPCPR